MMKEDFQKLYQDVIEQVRSTVHDLRSPVSSLMMINRYSNIADSTKKSIEEVIGRITEITENLARQYKNGDTMPVSINEQGCASVLVSTVLMDLFTEKRYQYQDTPCKLSSNFDHGSHFACVGLDADALGSMLSLVLDSLILSIKGDTLVNIITSMSLEGQLVKVTFEDDNDASNALIELGDKILYNTLTEQELAIPSIGSIAKARDLLQKHKCRFSIKPKNASKGTKITIILAITETPSWIADELCLSRNDTVIILDDEPFIHKAWKTRFAAEAPYIKLKDFEWAKDVVDYLNSISIEERGKILLLADYELSKHGIRGLEIITSGLVDRAILVTNHHDNASVRSQAWIANVKILPKQLALEVPITVTKNTGTKSESTSHHVDLVVVDDDELFVKNLCKFVFNNRKVDTYINPQMFLDSVLKYPKGTTILLDYDFGAYSITGLELAKQLHDLGFTSLNILHGGDISKETIPEYLKTFEKIQVEKVGKIK